MPVRRGVRTEIGEDLAEIILLLGGSADGLMIVWPGEVGLGYSALAFHHVGRLFGGNASAISSANDHFHKRIPFVPGVDDSGHDGNWLQSARELSCHPDRRCARSAMYESRNGGCDQ